MRRIYRDYERICSAEGLELVGIERGRKHCKLRFATGFITAAVSPSDHRNLQNVRSAIRRLHR